MKIKTITTLYENQKIIGMSCIILFLLWLIFPAIRGIILIFNPFKWTEQPIASIVQTKDPLKALTFKASDGKVLSGTLQVENPNAATVILVPGFKANQDSMIPWGNMLIKNGFNVFYIDDRGCGTSSGWTITLGAKEPDDIQGAVSFLDAIPQLKNKNVAVLGVSLGAGDAILAAAKNQDIKATIADSPWANENPQLQRMNSIAGIPLLPYESTFVSFLIGSPLQSIAPGKVVSKLSNRGLLLIHAMDDANALTSFIQEQELASKDPTEQELLVAKGGHVGAMSANMTLYTKTVVSFIHDYTKD